MRPILESAVGVTAITWGTLVLECLLSAALFMPKRFWRPLLLAGLALHAGIIVCNGLLSFAIVTFGALVLFLRPMEQAFDSPGCARWPACGSSQVSIAGALGGIDCSMMRGPPLMLRRTGMTTIGMPACWRRRWI
jgi:hypothetical protein